MQFLLGVDAPRRASARLREIARDRRCSTRCSRRPVYALVRRWLLPVAARGPAPPPAPRLHDRRPVAALAGLSRCSSPQASPAPARRPSTPQLALRVAILGGIAFALFAIIFFRLWFLQVLSGDQYLAQAHDNRVRDRRASRRRAARSSTATATRSSRTASRPSSSSIPRSLPAGRARRRRDLGPADDRALAAGRRASRGEPVPIPKPATPELAARYAALAKVLGVPREPRQRQRDPAARASLPYANVRVKVDVPQTMRDYLLEHQQDFPGIAVQQVYLRRYPHGTTAAQLVGTIGEINPKELGTDALPRRQAGHGRRPGRHRALLRPLPARRRRRRSASPSTPPGGPKAQRLARDPRAGPRAAHVARPASSSARRSASSRPSSAAGPARPARSSRSTRATARCSRWAPTRRFDPTVLAKPITQAQYNAIFGPGTRRAAVQPRDRRRLPDRLDVQADHRAGGARDGRHHARHADQRPRRR